ncbi:unnamed protein product [Paramecium octaurelia]|uniref:ADP-ribosylation factor n=1 Tax=Paramecium octaurelia TaxID=43137 RepID=A0A8S1VZU8_PAROT|nr:unnamed protein product [Paramecium octaurelia]
MGLLLSKIFTSLLSRKEMRILILGLDKSGKTTILYKLHSNELIQTAPTMGFNVETLTYKNLKFQAWDLGGQNDLRIYWKCYYPNTNGIIYVIDSFDEGRLKTSKEELMNILQSQELKDVPLLILANKQDMQGALSETQICEFLKLEVKKTRKWTIVKCSALTGLGLNEGMQWMANAIKK